MPAEPGRYDANLEFEEAAGVRDEIAALKANLLDMPVKAGG